MENMKKYVVICYAVHEEKIERYKTFDNKKDAYIFVKEDSQNLYKQNYIMFFIFIQY